MMDLNHARGKQVIGIIKVILSNQSIDMQQKCFDQQILFSRHKETCFFDTDPSKNHFCCSM